MSLDSLSDTVDDVRSPLAGPAPIPHVRAEVSGRTHVGKVRPTNQDNYHAVRFGRYLRTLVSSLPVGDVPDEVDQPGYGLAVADGMGGHAGGDIASRLAIALVIEYALQTPDWIMGHDDHLLVRVMERSCRRFQAVNEAVLAEARHNPELRGMGTTLSVALSLGDDLIVAHVGDSPVFLLRGGQLHRLTRDHSAVRRRPVPDEAGATRLRRVLTRAIGMPQAGGEPDVRHFKLADGDRLLLCSDGLTGMANDESIARVLGEAPSSDEATYRLLVLALEGGGRDNVTALVATYHISEGPAQGPLATHPKGE